MIVTISFNLVAAGIWLGLVSLTIWATWIGWQRARANALYYEALEWIREHRAKITGERRYLVGEQLFAQSFYDYSPKIIHKVWVRLVKENQFIYDKNDGCLAIAG